jgi:hypothetical protein
MLLKLHRNEYEELKNNFEEIFLVIIQNVVVRSPCGTTSWGLKSFERSLLGATTACMSFSLSVCLYVCFCLFFCKFERKFECMPTGLAAFWCVSDRRKEFVQLSILQKPSISFRWKLASFWHFVFPISQNTNKMRVNYDTIEHQQIV